MDQPFLGYRKALPIVQEFLNHFEQKDRRLKYHRLNENWSSLIRMVEKQRGWTIAPSSFLLDRKSYWIKDLPNKINSTPSFYLVYQKELNSISWFKELVQELSMLMK